MHLPEGWREVSAAEAPAIMQQLQRDLSGKHILREHGFMLLARRDDQDDLLLELDDGRIAELHMSWVKADDPKFPGALLFDDLDDWLEVQV